MLARSVWSAGYAPPFTRPPESKAPAYGALCRNTTRRLPRKPLWHRDIRQNQHTLPCRTVSIPIKSRRRRGWPLQTLRAVRIRLPLCGTVLSLSHTKLSALVTGLALLLLGWCLCSCGRKSIDLTAVTDPHLATNGTVEVTARLVEIPEGAIFKRDLYDYATILKYQVLRVHRGKLDGDALYVGQYNPWKPRAEAADKRAPGIGGNVRQFQAGQVHHLALEVPIEDYFMGGIVNKYFGKTTNTLYWAVWTVLE